MMMMSIENSVGRPTCSVAAWIDAKGRRSHKTHVAYNSTIAQFRAALRAKDLDTLARDDGHGRNQRRDITLIAPAFASFSAHGRVIASATFNQRLAVLSSFYTYAKAHDFLDYNPVDAIDRQKVQLPSSELREASVEPVGSPGGNSALLLRYYLQTPESRTQRQAHRLQSEQTLRLDPLDWPGFQSHSAVCRSGRGYTHPAGYSPTVPSGSWLRGSLRLPANTPS